MTPRYFRLRTFLFLGTSIALAACSTGPQITRTQDVLESADTPYENILVVTLFASFDVRRKFENDVVTRLAGLGTKAVASTSLMEIDTPVTRQTFLAMVETLDSDAVLVTQVVNLDSNTAVKDVSPQATYNVRPTYYFNVWEVELTEYVEPPVIEIQSSLVLATQLYSVLARESVWAIESKSEVVQEVGHMTYLPFIADEAKAISSHLSADGLIAR